MVQGLLGAQLLGPGPLGQSLHQVGLTASRGQAGSPDEVTQVSVQQLHPLQRLGPEVQIAFLKQEVLLSLVGFTQR